MAIRGKKKENYEVNQIFIQYEDEISNHSTYTGMPDFRHENGSIQWEAPSNRIGGAFKNSHDKRLNWWKSKAEEVGISITVNEWISKVAKKFIQPVIGPIKSVVM